MDFGYQSGVGGSGSGGGGSSSDTPSTPLTPGQRSSSGVGSSVLTPSSIGSGGGLGRGRFLAHFRSISSKVFTTTSSTELTPASTSLSAQADQFDDDTSPKIVTTTTKRPLAIPDPNEHSVPSSSSGNVDIITNFLRIIRDPTYSVYKYTFTLEPPIDDLRHLRRIFESDYVKQHLKVAPYITNSYIFLPKHVETFTNLAVTNPANNDGKKRKVNLTIEFVHEVALDEQVNLFNYLLKLVMKELNFAYMKKKIFSSDNVIDLNQYMMEIWPGHAVDICKIGANDFMLLCDISHRIVQQQTTTNVYNQLQFLMPSPQYRELACRQLIGQNVYTKYSKTTHRIDDIDFEKSPLTTLVHNNVECTYVEYYRQQWNYVIRHHNQPLLTTRKLDSTTGMYLIGYLIPEMCNLTGRSAVQDRTTLIKMINHVQPSPRMRYPKLMRYIEKVKNSSRASAILRDWGVRLDSSSFTDTTDKFPNEMIIDDMQSKGVLVRNQYLNAQTLPQNWNHLLQYSLLCPIELDDKWLIVYHRRDRALVNVFVHNCKKYAQSMQISIKAPRTVMVARDITEDYLTAIKRYFQLDDRIIVVVTPMNIEIKQRYDAIKQYCTIQLGIPTQFIRASTLGQPAKLEQICPNILVQMTCKMGGFPWGIDMPIKQTMYVGIDIYHRRRLRKKSVIGFVATLNSNATKWFSKAYIKEKDTTDVCDENVIHAMTESLYRYRAFNQTLPQHIIIYRDDVGITREALCQREYDLLMSAINDVYLLDDAVASPKKKRQSIKSLLPDVVFMTVSRCISLELFEEEKEEGVKEEKKENNMEIETIGGGDLNTHSISTTTIDQSSSALMGTSTSKHDDVSSTTNGVDVNHGCDDAAAAAVVDSSELIEHDTLPALLNDIEWKPEAMQSQSSKTEAATASTAEATAKKQQKQVKKVLSTKILERKNNGGGGGAAAAQYDEFCLVSQKIYRNCACPVRITVLRNTTMNSDAEDVQSSSGSLFDPTILQAISYKLCYLYYNSATISRQPAPTMYAQKVATFVGEHLGSSPNEDLQDKLFFL